MCFICSSWCVGSVLFLILVFPFPKQRNDLSFECTAKQLQCTMKSPTSESPLEPRPRAVQWCNHRWPKSNTKIIIHAMLRGWKGEQISGCWKYFHPEFGFKVRFYQISGSCNCSGLRIHQFFKPGFWSLRVIKIFLPRFWIQGEILMADLVNKS